MKIWSLYGSGKFDMCSYYAKLRDMNDISFPWNSIWSVKAPRQVSSFIWTTACGKILTHDNLIKRGYSLVSWCCMCQHCGEIVDHLLLHCDIASGLWNVVFAAFRIHWVMPKMVAELLFGWQNWFGKCSSAIWNLVPLCLMWLVWEWHSYNISWFRFSVLSNSVFLVSGVGLYSEQFFHRFQIFSQFRSQFIVIFRLFHVHNHEHDISFFQ